MTAPTELACPGCTTHVEATAKLDSIRTKWSNAGCKSGLCPAIACVAPGSGVCTATDAGSGGGYCTDQRAIATTQ